MILPWQPPLWLGTVVVLVLGTCLVVGLAALGARLTRSAVWQRTLWQVSFLGVLGLLAAEATGTSAGFIQWLRVQGVFGRGVRAPLPSDGFSSLEAATGEIVQRPALAGQDPVVNSLRPQTGTISAAPAIESGPHVLRAGLTISDAPSEATHSATAIDPRQIMRNKWRKLPACGVTICRKLEAYATEESDSNFSDDANAPRSPFWLRPPAALGYYWALVWTVGSGLLFARMVWARWLLQRFRRGQAAVEDRALRCRVERLARRLGLRRRVAVLEATGLATPIAFGFLRPVVVLPASFAEEFDDRQQEAMLAHELAHLAACDPAWQWLADLAAVLVWWHPLVWWARGQWRAAGEMAADEACLLVPQGADTLAACLVMVARGLECRSRLAWMAMAEPGFRSALGRRVERLLRLSARTWRPPTRRWISVATATVPVALLLAAVSCTAWARAQVPLAEGATTMKVFVNCWRQSLAAVAVAAVLSPAAGDAPTIFAAEGEPAPVKVEREGHEPAPVKVEREGERREAPAAKERREGERREGERREAREGGERRPEAREGRERGGEEREARAREMAERREQLHKEAQEIRHKLESLKPDQDAEARELKGALERIEHQLRELQAAHEPRPPMPDRARVQARLEELKAAIHRAAEAGKPDEAERLEREAHELMRMLEQRPGDRPPGAPEGAERERRLQHLRVAIDNLHAAGLHEPAEALARQAEALVRGGEMPREPRPEGGPRPEGPAPHLERAVQDLNRQMDEMRRQMEEIRQVLKTLSERR